MSSRATLYVGDAVTVLKMLPEKSVQCCVTSPPYWGLRDYGHDGQLGLERTPEEYVANVVNAFREVRRVLSDDGTLWLNIGDSYCSTAPGTQGDPLLRRGILSGVSERRADAARKMRSATPDNLKPKDVVGIPWRVAFALQADSWYLRSDIIWSKPNPMPESVRDRPTKAHEYVFLLSKNQRYYYDADAIAEPVKPTSDQRCDERGAMAATGNADRKDAQTAGKWSTEHPQSSGRRIVEGVKRARLNGAPHDNPFGDTRNARTVWEIATKPYAQAHFATFPPELAERCIKAGSRPSDTVLDPFGGSGTTASVAIGRLGRSAIHIDLNPNYLQLALDRIGPMLCDVKEWQAA